MTWKMSHSYLENGMVCNDGTIYNYPGKQLALLYHVEAPYLLKHA